VTYLGLGSNLGDRRAQLQRAVDALVAHGIEVLASSSVYETEPVGEVLDQPPFLNACLRVRTDLAPRGLLGVCKSVEGDLGRVTAGPGYVRHGPRPIDVDILAMGNLQVREPGLALPHPETVNRRFVLVPLLELDPDLELPGHGRAAAALEALGDAQTVIRHSGPLAVGSGRG
jgi:2-amino-4-hydroxy-6-hydroxymethyldihydropteridine diphosphokinase